MCCDNLRFKSVHPVLAVSAKTKQIPQRHMGRKSDNEKATTREEGFCHIMWARRLKEL